MTKFLVGRTVKGNIFVSSDDNGDIDEAAVIEATGKDEAIAEFNQLFPAPADQSKPRSKLVNAYAQIIGLFADMTDAEIALIKRQTPQWYEAELERILKEMIEDE